MVDWGSIHRMRLKSLMPGSCRADTDWSTLIHIDRHHMFNNWIRKSRDCLWTDRRKKQAWKITPVQTGHQMQNSFRQQRTNALGHYERHWLDSELLGWECCNQDCRSCNDSQKRTSSKTARHLSHWRQSSLGLFKEASWNSIASGQIWPEKTTIKIFQPQCF